jgi:hypothetical protein
MPGYKALYEQQLKKNKEHEEKIYELETQIVDLVDVRDIAEILGEDPEHYMNECCATTLATKIKEHKELQEENKNLKEQVEYWKHFALTYWSGDQLGDLEINTTGSDVWCEALDECQSNSYYDRKALTKKCMED